MSTQKEGRTLFKGGTVVTMDPKVPNLAIGDVLVEGDRIAAVAPNLSDGRRRGHRRHRQHRHAGPDRRPSSYVARRHAPHDARRR